MIEHAFPDDFEADDVSAFFKDGRRSRRHRSRKDAADVGVVSSRGGEENNFIRVIVKYGADDGDIGKVPAEVVYQHRCSEVS